MNLGNNHIGNFGAKGIVATKDNLEKNNISFFGQPDDAENNFLISEENGVKFALVGYNEFKKESDEDAIRQIAQVKKVADIVIVYAHWGKEYEDLPDAKQITLAHRFIDAGADVIIGSHPHVIQSIENYKNKYIFYSLGNFIFDQFFSPETQKGLNVQMHYDKKEKKFAYSLIPFQMKINFQWKIFSGEELNQELNRIADMSMVTETEKAKIRTGVL
jgi:poly-gamma-glutamate synthesis protein (capsule biosynthesis protein)